MAQVGSILPGGRLLQPFGIQLETGPGPFGLAVSAKGIVATADIGRERLGVTILSPTKNAAWSIHHLWTNSRRAAGADPIDPEFKGVFYGIAYEAEKSLWVAEGDSGKIRLVDTDSGRPKKIIDLNNDKTKHAFSADLIYDERSRMVWVIDQANFRVCGVDGKTGKVVSSVTVGRMPFALAISPDGKTLFVTNSGTFRYHTVPGATAKNLKQTGLPFPAFGFPSKEALNGVVRQTETGEVAVVGLGDPNVPESNSVSVIDVGNPLRPILRAFLKTGLPFSAEKAGGSAPSGVLAVEDRVFVSNAHDDSITILQKAAGGDWKIAGEIALRIPSLEQFRGIMPAGMAYDPVTKLLLVAEAGINAVGLVNVETGKIVAHIPVGWMPTRVVLSGDRVFVTNGRGRGAGPHLRNPLAEFAGTAVTSGGTLSTFAMPLSSEFDRLTARVFTSNGMIPKYEKTPEVPKAIKRVVLILKENRTFDEVFGDMKDVGGRKVNAYPPLGKLSMHGTANGRKEQFSLKDVAVTPNHHAIAAGFSFSDNFYADSDVSVDGHHWIVGSYPDLLTESGLLAAYGGNRKFELTDDAPGRLLFAGSDSSVHTDEQPEAGTLWHHLERNKIRFRNFGEGFELAGVAEEKDLEPSGARFGTNVAMPDPLFRNTSRNYPGFNMNIPDQYRADQFMKEMESLYGTGEAEPPQFIFIHLPNDHMAAPRAEDGYPYDVSYVADNDLALGRILEYLSSKPWWRETAVFVTEDDAQGGLDHVDAHRTVFLAASPWIKRGYVSHTNSSFPGLLKTIFELLGMPPLNLMDATAPALRDLFALKPDYSPYKAVPVDYKLFDPAKARIGTGKSIEMDGPKSPR